MSLLRLNRQSIARTLALGALMLLPALAVLAQTTDNPWDLQAVDADGVATHPKVGAAVETANRVIVEGIALNAPGQLLDTASQWQVYVQGEAPQSGGIAAWAGIFYNSDWPRYPADIEPGDRVRIEGYAEFHAGKTNLNERHSAAPDLALTVTILQKGAGMPEPELIDSIADCVGFDATRETGGEHYQGRWVELRNVRISEGTWGNGQSLVLTDDSAATLTLLLSSRGDFDDYSIPTKPFNVRGIFDQEDADAPYTGAYRLWTRTVDDFDSDELPVELSLFEID